MNRRFAPNFCFLLLWVALANGALTQTGGEPKQSRESVKSAESIKNGNRVKRSLNDEDKQRSNSGEDELLKLFSREKVRQKRDILNTNIDSERDGIPGNLYPETAIHNLEQTSDKVESDVLYRKSEIPTGDGTHVHGTASVGDKVVYNIGQDVSLEIPLDQPRVEELTKRDIVPQKVGSRLISDDKIESSNAKQGLIYKDKVGSNDAKVGGTTSAMKNSATRRDEVPLSGANFLRNSLDDASDEDFQIRDKSADLEIHADSSGVRVKAKPASLQVVSNPHGDVKTLPGEMHSEGVVAERRTFTPVLPSEKHVNHHHFHGLRPRPFTHLPFLRHRRHFRHHHRLPWLRHRQHINYPDVFERMRFNSMPEGPVPFGGMGLPISVAPPMTSMMNSPPPMMSEGPGMPLMSGGGMGGGGMGGAGMGGGGMGAPLIPQLLQRSPTMETNPVNRFGVPESPMAEMSAGGMSPMGRMNPMEDMSSMGRMGPMEEMSPMGRMGSMGDMPFMGGMSPMADMSPMSRMNAMGDMPLMGRMGSMGGMRQMESMMRPMSPSAPFSQSEMRRKNALEFWGMPNQDQLRALARGENVQKVLGSNRYGETLGGIIPGRMNPLGGMSPGLGEGSFNANGMGNNMMGPIGGTRSATFPGMSGGMGMRRSMLYKKDSINKTDAYKKSMKKKKSGDHKTEPAVTGGQGVSGSTRSGHEKFEEGILKKAQSLVAGEKHIAKNEESELHREHRIRKSSKLPHDEEKRSLDKKHSIKTSTKHQKSKNVKGSKKDIAVQRPPIIYHPPPEVFHRPDIVLHRPPVLFHRPPIVYHQAPVVVHRPAVVYRQSPIIFHQPYPVINQPYYRAWDYFQMNPAYAHAGSHISQAYNYLGLPPAVNGYRKEVVPHQPMEEGKKGKGGGKKESKRAEIPEHKESKKSSVDKNEQVAQKKKKDVVVNRPPIIYHPPPEVYHRPEIVVHRAPLLIRRPPIIYHQPAVIVHRPPVVYHQPPLIFHQPAPTVNQPVLYSHDNFVVHPSFFATHHGSIVSDAGQLLGVPNTVSVPDTGGFPYQPVGVNPGLGMPGGMGMPALAPMGRRKRSLHHKKKTKHENAKRKNAVMVKRPPIVYHPPPEVYHRPDIVVHRAPLVIHRSPIIYHQAPVVVHRPAVVYHQPPVMFHQPMPMVSQPTFTSHDTYTPHSTLTLLGSSKPTLTDSSVSLVAVKPAQKSSIKKDKKSNSEKKSHSERLSKIDEMNADSQKRSEKNKIKNNQKSEGQEDGSKKGHISKAKEDNAAKKNAVLVKRPPIVYHPPPEVYHRPDIVVHRAPLVIHRSPIVYHQAPVVVHRPAVVYHQPPVLFHQPPPIVNQPIMASHDVYHETSQLTHSGSSLTQNGAYIGVPSEVVAQPFGKSKVPRKKGHDQKPRRDITKEEETKQGSKKNTIANQDKTEKASKKNAVLVKRPPIIYHPPPEVYHRPDIVVHRAPIVIHRAPLVYHQAPVIVHRPAVVYHQPAVIFHQPPPMVHQPMFTAHDTFTPHDTLVLGGSSTQKVGDFEGPPPETLATRKGEVPKNVKGTGRNTIPKESKDKEDQPHLHTSKDKEEHLHQQSMESKGKKPKGEHPHRRSHLRKLILSLQKDENHAKKGLQVAGGAPLVLQRPPLILSRPTVVAPGLGSPLVNSLVAPAAHPLVQRVLQPVPIYQPVIRQVPVPVVRPVPIPVVYHHHHWPVHFHHHHVQPVMVQPHYTTYSYHPYSFGKSDVPGGSDKSNAPEGSEQKDTIHVHDFGVPAHGHVGHVNGNSHVVTHHGYVTRHANCPSHCGTCIPPNCPSDCKPHCIAIIHHQHHRPHHVFVNHQHHHNIAQTHFHNHHWPVHHHDVYHNHPYLPHRHIGHSVYTYPPYHHIGRRDSDSETSHDGDQKTTVPHYKVYQHVKHWHPPCIHNSQTCHHHHHPMTVYHDHHHPTSVVHHHHYTPYPVYHHHEHIKPVIYHHVKPYPIHHHHDHHIHDTWHHNHHVLQQIRYPVPLPVPVPMAPPPVPIEVIPTYHQHGPVPVMLPWTPQPWTEPNHKILGRSHVPHHAPQKETKKSETAKPDKKTKKSETSKPKNKKKDVVVNRPPIIYHPPPEVYHRPEIVVHRAPVLIHRPPIVYHQPAVIVHRPPVVYHQSPIIFHQPAPTVNQPVLYSHDNFVVHPSMIASHAGTMVESAGHFLGVPNGPITNFPGPLPSFGGPHGFGMEPYATPFGRKRRSTKDNSQKEEGSENSQKEDDKSEKSHNSKKADRKNAIVVHRPPVIYHPPPEIYHRPRVVVHRPDVLIHRPPIVYHQSPVVLHRPPVVYHQAPLIFHQPPPMVRQPVYHSHDDYAPHPVFTHYDSDIHHVGAYQGIPPYSVGYNGFGGFHGGFHGGFGGYPGLHGGIGDFHGGFGGFHGGFGGFHGGFGGFHGGFGRSQIEKPNHKKSKGHKKKSKAHKKSSTKSEKAHRKHSVMVHRPPVIFHPPPEIYHRPAYVLHQPDIVIHRPATVYHQSPVVVHHPPVAYHQHPIVYHQPPPVFVQPTYHHHQFFHECGGHGCYGGGPHLYGGFGGHGGCFGHGCAGGGGLFGGYGGHGGCFGRCGGFGGFGGGCCGGLGGGFHGGFPFLYGKSSVPKDSHHKKHIKLSLKHKTASGDSEELMKHDNHEEPELKTTSENLKASKRHHKTPKDIKGSKKNDIIIHRPPLVYHPPPEIYHRPDVVVHRPDVLVHRPSVVYDQPAVVLHRPAVIYHEPDVVFHQPPPLVNLPVYHASDLYAPHPVYEQAGSHLGFDHNVQGVPPHFSYGPYGVSHAFGKSKIEDSDDEMEKNSQNEKIKKDSETRDEIENTEGDSEIENAKKKTAEDTTIIKESGQKNHHSSQHARKHTKKKSKTTKAHKKYHLIMHRPPMIYHSSPTIYHRPDVVVHHPDIVIHRPSVVIQPPSVVVHKPAVVYHQPPVVFHQPEPAINQPLYHSHDAYEAHPVYTRVGSHLEHGGEYLGHPYYGYGTQLGFHGDFHNGFHGDFHGGFHDHVDSGFGFHGYGDAHAFSGFGKSKIQEVEEEHADTKDGNVKEDTEETGHDKPEHDKQHEKEQHEDRKHEKKSHEHAKRDTHPANTKRVQLPHAQKEKTETGTKKNAIVVRRPPIIYHPPPEVYHRPDIVVHRAPIVIQRAPLVYHQSPVIVHRPAVVYHQPAVVFHQPAPAVHQPVFHSVDTFNVHPHLSFSAAGSSVHQAGQYVGIPEELMHRSTVPTSSTHPSNVKHTDSNPVIYTDSHPKQRRATLEQDVTPITPLNFVYPRHPRFETPRSTIPYPTLHPHSLSYASFPWGYSPRTKRFIEGHPYLHTDPSTMVPHELFPLPYSPFFHHLPLTRPHVNINIETVKSNVPKGEKRERRQSILDPSQVAEPSPIQPEVYSGQTMPNPGLTSYPLPRPHVNVNIETVKSAVPRSRRQVLAGLPTQETQASIAPQTYSQAVVPAQLPNPPVLGVYRDLLGALYPRGVRRRPKVNIVVQTAKSNIPTLQNVKKSVLPSSLNKNNVDAFNTMPEVTTIEPPLLRDGVRVNMVDLGDPTAGSNPSPNFAPRLQPSYGNTNIQNYGTNVLGLGAQGNFGMDKWKKSAISEPSTSWHDVNAEKKSSVPSVHRQTGGKKRFMIGGSQSPEQFPEYQSGLEPQGSIPMVQLASAGYANPSSYAAQSQGSMPQPTSAGYGNPSNYAIEPQGSAASAGYGNPSSYAAELQGSIAQPTAESQSFGPQTSGAAEQDQSEPTNLGNQISGIPQPGRPHVNVNIETYKKETVASGGLTGKRQLIGTLPLTSLFRPNPNTAKASLKSMVPDRNAHSAKTAQSVTKRQQIMPRVPLAQAIPQLRNRVSNTRSSPAGSTRGYTAFPVQDTQPQTRAFPYQSLQPLHPQVLTPPALTSYVTPSPLTPAPSSYLHSTLYPWAGGRRHVNINIQTAKSKIATPSKSKKIITPRFKREFPVLYNIIKAKAKSDTGKGDSKTRRNKRQIPFFPRGGFLQNLIPDPNLLAKRAFYGSFPRYPMNPAVLVPRATRPRVEKQPMGTIEVGNVESPLSNAAGLLKNEFTQSFADIAKIQRQEVNDIKGMNMGSQTPSPPVVNMQGQASPGAEVVSVPGQGSAPQLMPAATASAVPVQEQAQQPEVVPVSAQQTMAPFAGIPQSLPAAGQPLPAQFASRTPMETAPGFVRAKPEPVMQDQAVQASDPAIQAAAPAVQAPEPAVQAPESAVSRNSPFTVITPQQLPQAFQPQFSIPGLQFPFLPPAEVPPVFVPPAEIPHASPYQQPFLNPIPQPEPDDSDRPSVNIQVQTSKSKIPKLQSKQKKDKKDKEKTTH